MTMILYPIRRLSMVSRQGMTRSLRSLAYSLVSIIVAVSIICLQPQLTTARPALGELLLQGVQVMQLTSISDQQEVSLGQQINDELLKEKQIKLYTDKGLTNYINQIGQRLASKSDRATIPYVFQVVDDKNINAFATVGGYVYVNTGLIQFADNEAQLASVMSHEIGHIVGRHAIKQMRQTAITRGLATAVGLDRSVLVKLGTEVAVKRRSSRQHEMEADQLGFTAMGRASYAQGAMVDFFKKLMTLSQGKNTPTILSTHPSTPDRVAALEAGLNPTTAYQGDGLNPQSYKVAIKPL
jgi:beta-barrel assembly-enhancing protease